ncbi:Arylsulfatase A [Streptomyces sp. yr375]|uniref:sulfatase family protein n=1 Tax=Streptomyces sp. yr375 TaxID=1761906 RepID=UPI0008AA9244|nr:sulfatase-like hydrolase/transferase [Streptomyces sp. yr375]SEQ00827.1 Arylsulfatase A [Streptomyces sp. yr375]
MPRTIILAMVDQLAAKWVEAADDGVVDLPELRRLRAEGAEFRHAFTENPVCTPARASIATGISSSANGVGECGYRLDPAVPTFMQSLQSAGWTTAAFGKLHFLPQLEAIAPDYRPYGFDVVDNTEDTRAGAWLDWVRETHPQWYDAAKATVWMTMVPELEDYGPDHENLRDEILDAQSRYPQTAQLAYELPLPAEVSQTAWITDRACEFLRHTPDGDVFAQVSYVQPHNPFTPPADYVDRVHVDAIPEPIPAEWQQDPIPYFAQERYKSASYDDSDWRRERQLYFADLAHLDHEIGRLRRVLEETGRLDDCLFVFTSDHGELLHDHGLLGKWERHYDSCIRVPLMIAAPSVKPSVRRELVKHTDITATIYDWARIDPPALPVGRPGGTDTISMLHGRSLLPLLTADAGAGDEWRDEVLVQSNNSHMDISPSSWARTIRTQRHRYTRYFEGGGEQMFDLAADPDERVNLAGDPAYRAECDELRARLIEATVRDTYPNTPRSLYRLGSW